jgi:hypothetical protein
MVAADTPGGRPPSLPQHGLANRGRRAGRATTAFGSDAHRSLIDCPSGFGPRGSGGPVFT